MLRRYSSNAAANVFSGFATAAYQLAVAAIAVSTWQGTDFATWGLAASIAAVAPVFALNLSSVVARRLTEIRRGGSRAAEAAVVQSGRRIGWTLGGLAFGLLWLIGAWFHVRTEFDALKVGDFLLLLGLVLATNGWMLFWQVRFGEYYAEERNWLVAFTLVFARAGGVLGMLGMHAFGSNTLVASATGLLAGTGVGLIAARLVLPCQTAGVRAGDQPGEVEQRTQMRHNLQVLSGFAFGAASSIVILYSIPPLIALIAPDRFNAFYVASTINAVTVGALSAGMSALLVPFARFNASGDVSAVQRVAQLSPALCAGASLAALSVCWIALEYVLAALSPRGANLSDIRYFLALLGLQTIVRTAAAGVATFVASAGTARQMVLPLAVEMVIALTVAAPLGLLFGVQGLLSGLVLAALIGSQFSAQALAWLSPSGSLRVSSTVLALLGAQVVGAALWLCIVAAYL